MRAVRLTALALALACSGAGAELLPETVGAHVASWHVHEGFNNVNPGLYARWDSGLTMGAYWNSERAMSAYAGWTFSFQEDRYALTVGAVSGYQRAAVLPLVVPSVKLRLTEQASVRLSWVLGPKGGEALHLSVERRF